MADRLVRILREAKILKKWIYANCTQKPERIPQRDVLIGESVVFMVLRAAKNSEGRSRRWTCAGQDAAFQNEPLQPKRKIFDCWREQRLPLRIFHISIIFRRETKATLSAHDRNGNIFIYSKDNIRPVASLFTLLSLEANLKCLKKCTAASCEHFTANVLTLFITYDMQNCHFLRITGISPAFRK